MFSKKIRKVYHPNRKNTRQILRGELKKLSSLGFDELNKLARNSAEDKYEITSGSSVFQITINYSLEGKNLVNVLGAIDGPGVLRILGFVISITDFFAISRSGDVEFKR